MPDALDRVAAAHAADGGLLAQALRTGGARVDGDDPQLGARAATAANAASAASSVRSSCSSPCARDGNHASNCDGGG